MEYTHCVNICLINTIRVAIISGILLTQAHAAAIIHIVERDRPCTNAVETSEVLDSRSSDSQIDTTLLDLISSSARSTYNLFDLTTLKIDAGAYLMLCDNRNTGANCDLEVSSDTGWLQKTVAFHNNPNAVYIDDRMLGLMANEAFSPNPLTLADTITYTGADGGFSPFEPDDRANSRNTNNRISFQLHSNLLCLFGIQKCNPDGL